MNKTSYNKSSHGLVKRIATILLASAMIVPVALSASACKVTIKDNGDGTFNIDPANPSDNTGNSQGSTNTPQGGQTTPKEPDYSMYSPLLQEVLNDPYYDELYRMYENGALEESGIGWSQSYSNFFCAIPYDFLESIGENVEDIKKSIDYSLVGVWSNLYTIENEPNYIYNSLYVYHSTDGKGWFDNKNRNIHQYLLQYKITEQELKDLEMLYWDKYFQGPVMFQRLASKQTPKVIKEFSLTENANKNLISGANNHNSLLSKLLNLDKIESVNIMSMTPTTLWDKDGYNTTFWLFSAAGKAYNGWAVTARKLYEVDAQQLVSNARITFNNNILDLRDIDAMNPVLISTTPITYFQLYHAFKNFKDRL